SDLIALEDARNLLRDLRTLGSLKLGDRVVRHHSSPDGPAHHARQGREDVTNRPARLPGVGHVGDESRDIVNGDLLRSSSPVSWLEIQPEVRLVMLHCSGAEAELAEPL